MLISMMNFTKPIGLALAVLVSLGWASGPASADVVTTLDGSQGYVPNDVSGTGSVAITATNPRSGTGSLEFNTNGTTDKATVYGFTNQGHSPLGTLGDLIKGSLSYDVYRDGSDTAGRFLFPSFKLYISNGSPGGTASLTYEPVYNGYPVSNPLSSDEWHHLDILGADFYERDHGVTRTNYNLTLKNYANGDQSDPTSPVFSSSSVITAIEIGVGSGITGTFHSFADNVNIDFNNGLQFDSNFEAQIQAQAVPEPSAIVLTISGGLFGVVYASRRRKRAA